MTIACALLQQDIQTLVDDNAQWQKLIADHIMPNEIAIPVVSSGATPLRLHLPAPSLLQAHRN